jgi:hypothetical protein
MRSNQVTEKCKSRPRHADDHLEFAGLQPFNEADGIARVIERAFLNRGRNEWITPLLSDKSFHFLGAAAF